MSSNPRKPQQEYFETSNKVGRGKAQKSLDLIAAARDILEEIHPASVRAVCYQLFIRGLIGCAEETQQWNKPCSILYVGDFDPSGLYMSEVDLPRRLATYGARDVTLIRVALTRVDVLRGTLASFALKTKKQDPRVKWYRSHGHASRCWEVDAMTPTVLRARVRRAIRSRINAEPWARSVAAEHAEVESIESVLTAWNTSRQDSK